MKKLVTIYAAAVFLLTVSSLVQAAGVDMNDCEVLYHFNNQAECGESGTYIHDSSGSGHYGSVPAGKTAGYVTNGIYGGAVEFDGTGTSDHRIFIHNGMTDFWNNAGQWSVAMWIKTSTTSSSQNIIGAVNPTTGTGSCTPWIWYGAGGYGGRIQLASWYHSCPGSAYDPSVSSDANILDLNQWTHITMTRDSNSINFYKNGVPWGGFTAVSSQNSSLGGGNTDLQIGACGSSGARLRGMIDELVIFSRALSSDEVNDLFLLGEITGPDTVYVDDDYTPTSCGGHIWGWDAFDNIQDGICAVCCSTVHVAAGTYTEAVTISAGSDLTIQGAGRDVTTWIAPADDASRMHSVKCDLSGLADTTTLDISGFTFSVEDNAISTSGIAILINRASSGPLYLSIHDNKFIETTTIANETANSMLLCHNRFASRGAEAPVKIYNNLDYTTGGIAMSNSQAFDIYNNVFDGGSDALYIGYGCPENTTVGDHHIYNNTFKNASSAYPSGPWPSIFFSYYGSGTGMTFLPSTIENNSFQDNDMAIGYEMESNITYPSDAIHDNSFEGSNDYAVAV